MRFDNTLILYLLWLTPFLVLFFVYANKKRKVRLEKFIDKNLIEKLISGFSYRRRKVKYLLLVIAFIFVIIALARPQIGFTWEEIHQKGVDIYVAVDVSDSMLAEDFKPNRLERAKRELIDLINLAQGDRIGLVLFAGNAIIQVPLTSDYNALQMFIDEISTHSVPVKGTSVSSAIDLALASFSRASESSSKAIILITDGEDHEGNLKALAEKAKDQGVKVFAIGVGSSEGVPIPLGPNRYKRNAKGEIVKTKADFSALKMLAQTTGGVYTNSVTGQYDLTNIYVKGIKNVLADDDLVTKRRKNWIDRYQWILAFVFILLAVETILSERTNKQQS